MKSSAILRFVIFAGGLVAFACAPAHAAANCTAADFGAIVDQTAQALRDLNANGARSFQAKLATLRQKNGLSQDEIEARAAAIQDEKIEEFNREIDGLVNRMDLLSQTPNNQVTCAKLAELKRVRDRLLTVMGQKSGYMLARAEVLLDKPAGARTPKAPATAVAQAEQPKTEAAAPKTAKLPEPKAETGPETKIAPAQETAPALPEKRSRSTQTANNSPSNSTATGTTNSWTPEQRTTGRPPAGGAPANLAPPPAGAPLPPPGIPEDNTFSAAEIREAGRGLFGTVTAEFAGAIDYTFQKFGQPNAYITGGEGGGAFLAGLRYGKGTLHRKGMPDMPIFWQGPSAGLDLGAEGSRALFLVYNLNESDGIYGRFSGIGGSAYVAGGIGINVLGKGKVVMVPIRSGVGLRLGANLAYLKFTDRQTWNPF